MTKTELEVKVSKAQEKVAKIEKTIERHSQQLEKKKKNNADAYEIKWKEEDIKGATRKLKDAQSVLENWQNKLKKAIEEEMFLEENTPQVIKDFLENWKTMAYDWHVKRFHDYKIFVKELDQKVEEAKLECIKSTSDYSENIMYNYLIERGLDYRSIRDQKINFAGAMVLKMCEFRDEAERLAWLEKELEEEKRRKMFDLINRIIAITGKITDASLLEVSPKGNLDGIVKGEKGMVNVQTIGAGGFNIQCFHYRTLVHKVG